MTLTLTDLRQVNDQEVDLYNRAIHLVHGARLARGPWRLQVTNRPAPPHPALAVQLEAPGGGLWLAFEDMPVAGRLHDLIAPWSVKDLTPALRIALFDTLAADYGIRQDNSGLALKAVCFPHMDGEPSPATGPFRFCVTVTGDDAVASYVHCFPEPGANLETIARLLGVHPGAALYPPSLSITLPLVAGTGEAPLDVFRTLEPGDIILLNPPPPAAQLESIANA